MTVTDVPPMSGAQPAPSAETPTGPAAAEEPPASTPQRRRWLRWGSPGHITIVVLAWIAAALLGIVLVWFGVGPLLQQREQHALLSQYRTDVDHAANEAGGLGGVSTPTRAPSFGDPVAIVEINRLHLQQVVVEGVGPQETRRGPGHVPGTAGLGQPGNSAVVGRRAGFGGTFANLGDLRHGDKIVVVTTEGRSLYRVKSVRTVSVSSGSGTSTSEVASGVPGQASVPGQRQTGTHHSKTTDDLYGPTDGDQLTLVSSASWSPWSSNQAHVVVASMVGLPFSPLPQNGRTSTQDGRHGDGGAGPLLLLLVVAYALTAVAAMWTYRYSRIRSAYLLTAPLLLAFTFMLAETVSRFLPAWF